jgi:hypothetical protein
MAVHDDLTFTALDTTIVAWKRGRKVCFEGEIATLFQIRSYLGHTGRIHTILPFGDHLFTLADDNRALVFAIATGGTRACHPLTPQRSSPLWMTFLP